jgi:hypothetical protein
MRLDEKKSEYCKKYAFLRLSKGANDQQKKQFAISGVFMRSVGAGSSTQG